MGVRRSAINRMLVLTIAATLCGGCCVWIARVWAQARQTTCGQQLKCLWLALQGFESNHRHYPAVHAYDEQGIAIQSWRAAIMPHLGHYHFDETYDSEQPWDSPQNRRWTDNRQRIFRCPQSDGTTQAAKPLANYVAVVGPDTMWPETGTLRKQDVTNPDAIFVVEYPESDIPWGEPRDLSVDEFLSILEARRGRWDFGPHPSGLLYVTASGDVRALGRGIDLVDVRALLKAR